SSRRRTYEDVEITSDGAIVRLDRSLRNHLITGSDPALASALERVARSFSNWVEPIGSGTPVSFNFVPPTHSARSEAPSAKRLSASNSAQTLTAPASDPDATML